MVVTLYLGWVPCCGNCMDTKAVWPDSKWIGSFALRCVKCNHTTNTVFRVASRSGKTPTVVQFVEGAGVPWRS